MNEQWWSWILTAVGVACFFLAGKKVWWAWYVGLVGQITWLFYSLITEQWGFLVGVVLYTVVYSKNAFEWTRARNKPEVVPYKRVRLERDEILIEGTEVGKLMMFCSWPYCPGYEHGAPATVYTHGIVHHECDQKRKEIEEDGPTPDNAKRI